VQVTSRDVVVVRARRWRMWTSCNNCRLGSSYTRTTDSMIMSSSAAKVCVSDVASYYTFCDVHVYGAACTFSLVLDDGKLFDALGKALNNSRLGVGWVCVYMCLVSLCVCAYVCVCLCV
jgi:hypothetical protein